MKDYPKLAEMGVMHPKQISKFLVNSISNYDVLRIVYNRSTGSLLPTSRTYKFPRIQKTVTVDSGSSKTAVVMESHPCLRAAIDELQVLTETKKHKQDLAESILEQLELLEEDIALRSAFIKELVNQK